MNLVTTVPIGNYLILRRNGCVIIVEVVEKEDSPTKGGAACCM